ncbi:MAG TPA: hypothetical protein VGA37_08835 [Gemmatimonadales bacterium]
MKATRWVKGLFAGAALLAALSCMTDSMPTGINPPEVPAGPEVGLGALLRPLGLLRCDPLPADTTVQTIGPSGGSLRVGPHRLLVPPGALAGPVTITAIAPSDTVNAVQLTPHGLSFEYPAYLEMSYANCDLVSRLLPKRIAYTTDIFEILEFLRSWDNFRARRVTGRLDHFSQYAVSW